MEFISGVPGTSSPLLLETAVEVIKKRFPCPAQLTNSYKGKLHTVLLLVLLHVSATC